MARKRCLLVWLAACVCACGDDAETHSVADGGASDAAHDSAACPSTGTGTLMVSIDIDDGVAADVRLLRADQEVADSSPITASASKKLDAGMYRLVPHRVRHAGELIGAAYQGAVQGTDSVCVKSDKTSSLRVVYTREPGSTRLWLTQSNGSGAQVMAFDADQIAARGDQTPALGLAPKLNSAGPIRVDGLGRLWVGSNTGKLVAYKASRLGAASTSAPDIELEGPSICDMAIPCGPRAIAFDAKGALWVATLHRIVKLAAASLNASGQPSAAVTIESPAVHTPNALAFDDQGSLWVGDSDGAVVKFDASHLATSNDNLAADTQIHVLQPGPVMIGLGSPEGLVFDRDGNLWVGYFAGNDLVRISKSELGTSAPADKPLKPSVYFKIDVLALVTDLALDEGGNLWLPGSAGKLYRIAKDQLSVSQPMLSSLNSAEIGSVERIAFNTVPGALFIAP